MTASVGGGASLVNSPDGHGYLHVYANVQIGTLLNLAPDISTFPGGSSINPGISSPLIPGSSVGGSLLAPILPPILAPIVNNLLGAVPSGGVGGGDTPPAGSTSIIDLGGAIINLPGAFK